mgnify:CR=1 FL=1
MDESPFPLIPALAFLDVLSSPRDQSVNNWMSAGRQERIVASLGTIEKLGKTVLLTALGPVRTCTHCVLGESGCYIY